VDPASEHGDSAGHGLQEDDAESFAAAGHYVSICEAVVIGLPVLRDKAGEEYAIRYSAELGLLPEPGGVLSLAADHVHDVRNALGQFRQRLDDLVESFETFEAGKPADRHDHGLVLNAKIVHEVCRLRSGGEQAQV